MKIKSKAIRQAANGENCTLQIAGICNYKPETTVFAHLPDESNGMGTKSDDLSGCFGCSDCHSCVDGGWTNLGEAGRYFKADAEFYFRRAMVRTWRRLFELGILTIKGMR